MCSDSFAIIRKYDKDFTYIIFKNAKFFYLNNFFLTFEIYIINSIIIIAN